MILGSSSLSSQHPYAVLKLDFGGSACPANSSNESVISTSLWKYVVFQGVLQDPPFSNYISVWSQLFFIICLPKQHHNRLNADDMRIQLPSIKLDIKEYSTLLNCFWKLFYLFFKKNVILCWHVMDYWVILKWIKYFTDYSVFIRNTVSTNRHNTKANVLWCPKQFRGLKKKSQKYNRTLKMWKCNSHWNKVDYIILYKTPE